MALGFQGGESVEVAISKRSMVWWKEAGDSRQGDGSAQEKDLCFSEKVSQIFLLSMCKKL